MMYLNFYGKKDIAFEPDAEFYIIISMSIDQISKSIINLFLVCC